MKGQGVVLPGEEGERREEAGPGWGSWSSWDCLSSPGPRAGAPSAQDRLGRHRHHAREFGNEETQKGENEKEKHSLSSCPEKPALNLTEHFLTFEKCG